ncbi:mixed lineage kinase [Chlorella sorokiniana]|uniref:Mixed lineage kinase n=1 Tax=Chlorella sorokiniana TaxID=3076 RepID=A0A2P6TJT1_CHLSO|nr:mixed lineage kinase [Chlorella sorokiniana]|eukprot:PRW44344.1 mixed lineage kinase [Chlorella sorokiniana]
MGACVSSQAAVADWTGEGPKPARSAAPRVCGSGAVFAAARASVAKLDRDSPASPSLSVGSSLYSLYTEASSHEAARPAPRGNQAPAAGGPCVSDAHAGPKPTLPVVVSEPIQGLELGAVVGRWASGLVYHGVWQGQAVAVTISDHRLDAPEKTMELEQRLRRVACSADLRHPSLAPLYCCSLVRHSQEPEAVVCERCVAATSGELCDHVEEEEGAEWRDYLNRSADDSSPGAGATRLEVWTVTELGYCTLEGAIRRGWLHIDSTIEGAGEAAAEEQRPRLRRILNVAHDLAAGLQFMHSKGLVHGELSGANVAVCSGPRGYSAKLGSALHQATRAASAAERRGMEAPRMELLLHTPPEVLLRGEEPSPKADVYALGTCLWEMFSGKLACPQLHPVALLRAHHARRSPLPPLVNCPPAFQALVSACMSPDAADRPDSTEVLTRLETMLAEL